MGTWLSSSLSEIKVHPAASIVELVLLWSRRFSPQFILQAPTFEYFLL